MMESFSSAPEGRRAAGPPRMVVVLTVVALAVLAVAQLLSWREGGWNAGLILLASMILANFLWRYRRRE